METRPALARLTRVTAAVFTVTLGAGCATFSDDGGFSAVETVAQEKLGQQARWTRDPEGLARARAETDKLLESVLTSESVVQIALLNNPALQAAYAELGISEADLVQAGRIPNPGFTFTKTTGGGTQEIERGLHVSLYGLLTMPFRVGVERRRFEAAKLDSAAETVRIGLEARSAFFEAVGARQTVRYLEQVVESAEASRELMTRMRRIGNTSRLRLAREQLFHAEAVAGLARAKLDAGAAREALIRTLGLWGRQLEFRLPDRLPDLPDAPRSVENLERAALGQRLDVAGAKFQLESLSKSLGLTKATRFIDVLEIGALQVRDRGEPVRDGYEISIEIPIFDWGSARVAKAEALYMRGAERLRDRAIRARSEVRQAYQGYRAAYELSKHYRDEIVPLRRQISDEQLLRYNGMLIGVFELIADSRDQIASVNAYLAALRGFWLAENGLQTAMLISGSGRAGSAVATVSRGPNGGAGGGH